jgi:CRISPR-associated protein Cmr4
MNKRYFALALDPIHVGTGGYRLGRVDNTIVREPGTNLPKIPGTTIEGNTRTYAYYAELEDKNSKNKKPEQACALGKELDGKKPCGICPICITFGYTGAETTPESLHGMAQFSDARILFFPVHSMLGPVWVTSPSVLKELSLEDFSIEDKNKIKTSLIKEGEKLNLGWLYLENEEKISLEGKLNEITSDIKNRFVLVSDKLFSQIVNSNLEVRTSVAIDPRTGAAEEGALFTYEAIPRATILWFYVIPNTPSKFDLPEDSVVKTEDDVINEVVKGLRLFETLGIGGMQTRGFGRMRILNLEGDDGK